MPARLRTLAALTGGLLVLAGPAFADVPAPDCHGYVLTDPANDQYILTPSTGLLVRPSNSIDIEGAFILDGTSTVNIQVANLPAAPLNTDYTFHWDSSTGGYWELNANFQNGASYTWTHALSESGSPFTLRGTTGAVHPGPHGVISIDLPSGESFPATMDDLSVRAEQHELNVTSTAVRLDTASTANTYSTGAC